MKKRILSLILCIALLISLMTPVFAKQDVPENVGSEETDLKLLSTIQLKDSTDEETFLSTPSGIPPAIPASGFLVPLAEPLPTPGENGLMCDVGDPSDNATAISTVDEFLTIGTGGNYYLDHDIDLSALTDWAGITLEDALTLDGQGHTISGLACTLFNGKGPVTLRNLVIETAEAGANGCSVLLSYDGTLDSSTVIIDNCTIRGTFLPDWRSSAWNGAFIGYNTNETSALTNCAFIGTIDTSTATTNANYVGGIAGYFSGLIENCYVEAFAETGEYALATNLGGIVGQATQDVRRCTAVLSGEWWGSATGGIARSCDGTVSDCCVILAEDMQLGGVSNTGGIASSCKSVENCWVRGGAIWGPYSAGGIANRASVGVSNCYAVTNLMSGGNMGGIVALSPDATISDCVSKVAFSDPDEDEYYAAGIAVYANIVQRCAAYGDAEGTGIVGGIAYNAFEVRDCIAAVNNAAAGIVYEGNAYNCCVNGASGLGYGIANTATTIVDCAVRNATCTTAGIAYSATGTISGCLVEDSIISGDSYVAGIVAMHTTVSDCHVIGCTITSSDSAGGIEGYLYYRDKGKIISGCTVANCTILAAERAGGILSRADMTSRNGSSTYVISDCTTTNNTITATNTYTEEITNPADVTGYVGGIVGHGSNGTILACVADNTITGFRAGGIAGSESYRLQSCTSSGSVYGVYSAGGIAGCAASSVDGCYTDTAVAGDTYIGGLFGNSDGGKITNCESAGTVTGKRSATAMGGLVGIVDGGNRNATRLTSLIFSGTMAGELAKYSGGLVGQSTYGVFLDCHVTQPIDVSAPDDAGVIFGGFLGDNYSDHFTGNYIGSSFYGNTFYSCSCADITLTGGIARFGGFVGLGTGQTFENCTVNGDISVYSTRNTVYASPFMGENTGTTKIANCWINGDAHFSSPSYDITDAYTEVGVYCTYNHERISVYNSGILKSASDPNITITVNGVDTDYVDCILGDLIELDTYDFFDTGLGNRLVTISVLGGYYGGEIGFPLAGAKVTVAGVSGYTNTSGIVSLQCGDEVYQDAVEILIEKVGYPTYRSYHCFASNMSTYSATLMRLAPGKIMIESGSVRITDTRTRSIFSDIKVRFAQDDKMLYNVDVNVNWNGHTPDKVYLKGMKSGRTTGLQVTDWGASGLVCFGSSFDADEYIQVVAVTQEDEKYGVLEAHSITNLMVQTLEVHIVVTEPGNGTPVSSGEEESTFFMESAKFKLDLKDLIDGAASISLENNVLTITFKSTDTEKTTGDLLALNDLYVKDDVYLSGRISVPYTDLANGEWSGSVKVGMNQGAGIAVDGQKVYEEMVDMVESDKPLHVHTFGFAVAGVPCYVETGVGLGGSAELEIYGTLNKPETKGTLTATVTGEAGVGIGGTVAGGKIQYAGESAIEVKLGGYGSLTGNASVSIDTAEGFDMNPSLSGDLGAKVSVHLFIINFEDKLSVGEFYWDKTGLTWRLAGEEGSIPSEGEAEESLSLMSADAGQWQLIGRDYLNNITSDSEDIQLLAVNGGTIEIENIIQVAELANSTTVKYYTADDIAIAAQQNAMKLYAVVGSTTYTVDDSATSDVSPSAAGDFVSWIDVKETKENDLGAFLRNTEIAVSRYDSENACFTDKVILTDESADSHVYAPVTVIPGSGNGKAAVAWLSADVMPDGQLDFTPDEVEVWYATYDGTAWSDATLAATVDGTVSSLQAAYGLGSDIDTLYLDYQVDGDVYEVTVSATTETDAETGESTTTFTTSEPVHLLEDAYAFVRNYNCYSWQNENGLYLGKLTSGTWLDTHGLMNESPVLAVYPSDTSSTSCSYAYWAVGNQIWGSYARYGTGTLWSDPQLLCEEDGYVHELSLYTTNVGVPQLRYLVDTENGTNLVTQGSNLTKNAKIERVVLTADTLEVTVRQYAINTTSTVSNSWALYDAETNTKLLSGGQYIKPGETATFVIDRDKIPETGVFRFDITGDSYTFTINGDEIPALVSIEDALWENGLLRAYILSEGSACGEMTLTVTDQEGNAVDTWTVPSDDYETGLWYLAEQEMELEDGIYILTAAVNDTSDRMVFGVGDSLTQETEDVFLDDWWVSDGSSEIQLENGSLLNAELLAWAAEYSADGRMTNVVIGTLKEVNGVWYIDLPCEIRANWTVYLIDPVTYAPVCEVLTGF